MNFGWAPARSSFYAEGQKNGFSTLITPDGETTLGKVFLPATGSLDDAVPEISVPGFSAAAWTPDGLRLFFLFTDREGTSLYGGSKKFASYEAAGRLAVSPEGKPAFMVREGGSVYLMWQGQKLGPYNFVIYALWSPVGEKLLYTAKNKDMTDDVYIDGKRMSEFFFGPIKNYNASFRAWPPDGSTPAIAYDASLVNVGGSMLYTGSDRRGPYKTKPAGVLGFGNWAPRGKKLGYVATKTDDTTWAFIGDEEIGPLDAKFAAMNFYWAPDAVSYAVCMDKKILVNGKTYSYDGKNAYIQGWSDDSKILAYTTSSG